MVAKISSCATFCVPCNVNMPILFAGVNLFCLPVIVLWSLDVWHIGVCAHTKGQLSHDVCFRCK